LKKFSNNISSCFGKQTQVYPRKYVVSQKLGYDKAESLMIVFVLYPSLALLALVSKNWNKNVNAEKESRKVRPEHVQYTINREKIPEWL
jgi:hypothetical protein